MTVGQNPSKPQPYGLVFKNLCVFFSSGRGTSQWVFTTMGKLRNMVIMLIGNKCDLERREVSFEEGAWFARQPLGRQLPRGGSAGGRLGRKPVEVSCS